MKKFSCFMLLCLLILVFFLFHLSQSSTVGNRSIGRRLVKEVVFLPAKAPGTEKIKTSEIEVDSVGVQHSDEEEGLVYSADYRGVTTHPSPLPKHPDP